MYRTQPELKLFASQAIQSMLIRLLFVWTIRHPASGYVQGINDMAAPILMTFLQGVLIQEDEITEEDLLTRLSHE